MLEAVGDTGHTRFLDPEEAEEFEEATRGEIIGVGVELDLRGGLPVVVAPIDGSPAAEAGIRSGDTILEVDGQETEDLDMGSLTDLIRGDEGSQVTLILRHAGDTETFEVTLTRRKITIDPVTLAMLPNGVAHVRISDFSEGTTADLIDTLRTARNAGATSVILDLRDNPGGLVDEAIGVASQFLPEGTVIFQQQNRGEEARPVPAEAGGETLDLPMLVLINQGTASAAEIVAGALNDNGRADLVGETTYGTGTVLIPFALDDGSVALIGTSFWLTANGSQIWEEGVVPDVEVDLPLDAPASRPSEDPEVTPTELQAIKDSQLQYAFSVLTSGQ
jgi:carboxyl-terminal processing protease